ncbi:MAG: TolC family protein [Anaerovoracaceae bacterium]
MKKNYLRSVLAAGIICTMTMSSAVVFADTAAEVEKEVASNSPSGQTISLSLEGAYKKLESSLSMEMLKVQKENDTAIAKGYSETVSNLKKLDDAMDKPGAENSSAYWTYDSSNKKMVTAMRTFAMSVIEPNHTARVNALKRDTFENYYTLKNLEEQVAIAKENVTINEKLFSNTQLMYKVGKASDLDLNSAESSLNTAKDGYRTALDGLNTLKMSFNISMDYPLMQSVKFTDEIKEVALPKTTLDEAIKKAKENRLEIKEAAYNLQMANLNFDNYKAYPSTSSKYMSAKVGVLGAQLADNTAPKQVEMDVRMKYAAMNTAYQKVQTSKKAVKDAAESAKIVQIQYEYGMATITTLQQANLGLYNAKLSQANALLEYNLAVEDFELSQGVGTTAANIAG